MATLTTYAQIVTPDLTQYKMYQAGIKKNPPGVPLSELLEQTTGEYEFQVEMSPRLREDVLRVARLTADEGLLHYASTPAVPVSLEHLRHLDPKTRIVVGIRLNYTMDESERLGLKHEGPFDPQNTIFIDNSEAE